MEKTLDERAKDFMEEYRVVAEKHKIDMRPVMTKYGLKLEVFDMNPPKEDELPE